MQACMYACMHACMHTCMLVVAVVVLVVFSSSIWQARAMKRKFKCVYPASGGGWWAKRRGTYLGHAATEVEAARLVKEAEARDQKTRRPEAQETRSPGDQKFQGVTWHKGAKGYVAQVKVDGQFKTIGGLHRTPLEAAKTIQQNQGVTSLLKKSKKDLRAAPFRARFLALQRLYCLPEDPLLQGDLEISVKQYQDPSTRRAFQQEPGLEQLSEMAKYGPIKEYLVQRWKARRPEDQKHAKARGPAARARILHQILTDSAKHFSGKDLTTPWVENCGRFVSQHSGFVPLLHRLNVVRAWRPGDQGPKLDFSKIGGSTVPRTLLPFQSSKARLLSLIKRGDTLQEIPVPTSGLQWEEALEGLKSAKGKKSARRPGGQATRRPGGQKKKRGYLELWRLRTHWFPIIASRVDKKTFDTKGLSLRSFHNLLPDAGKWVLRLAPRQPYTVAGLFSEVGFRANPILFSCYACLFADAGVIKYSAEQIEGAQQQLKKALREYRAKHGIWPHPAILLQKVFDPAKAD